MVSFKQAAVIVLQASKEPLHYREITKRALERDLIQTSGSTPESTMNAKITGDIKRKKEKSQFIRVKLAMFSLNPSYVEKSKAKRSKLRRQ